MNFYTNFSRVFRFNKFFQKNGQGEKWQSRRYVAPIQFHRSMPRSVINNFESSKRAVKAVLILSYKPQRQMQIHGNNLVNSSEYESILGLILIVARIFVIGSVLTGLAIVYFVTRFTHRHVFSKILRKGKIIHYVKEKYTHQIHKLRVVGIEFLGPIFIKFGQWASTRKDLFSEDVCRTLSQLQQSASAHSWIYTKQLLKAIYGSNWRDIFVKFEHEMPIGSGCCGQV